MKRRYGTGLFIGRFQPFHKGHLYALRYALSHSRNLIIGIGSSQEKGTKRNPLPSKDRILIIKAALKGTKNGGKGIKFIEIPDFHDNDLWFGHIMKKIPDLDVVFSRHWLVRKIFRDRSIPVLAPPWHKRHRLSATKVRQLIGHNLRWQDRVPRDAVKEIESRHKSIRRSLT